MKKRSLFALGLACALTLSLAGCAKTPAADGTPPPVDTAAPATTPAPRPDAVPEDLTLAAAGIPGDTVVLTVDGTDVKAETLFYWMMYSVDQISQYAALDWTTEIKDGQNLAEYLTASAVDMIKLHQVIFNHAQEMGVALSGDNKASLESQMTTMAAQMGQQLGGADGQRAYQYYLGYQGLTDAGFRQVQEAQYLVTDLRNALYGEGGELVPTAEEFAQWADENGIYRAKHILVSAEPVKDDEGNVTDDGMAAALAKAQELRAKLKENNDDQAYFDLLMQSDSTDPGLAQYPQGYVFGPGEMVQEFYDGTAALAVGQVSEPIQTDYGYHIILRLDPDVEEGRDLYSNDQISTLVDQWATDAVVETNAEFDKIDLESAYTKMTELRTGILEAMQNEFMPQETTAPQESTVPQETGAPEPTPTPVG